MRRGIVILFVLAGLLQSCNTLYNSKAISIEVLVPGKAKIKPDYKKLAVKYNNINIAWNPLFANHYEDTTQLIDITNSDSIASRIYYQVFNDFIKGQNYFDTIIELQPFDFTSIAIDDSLVLEELAYNNITDSGKTAGLNPEVLKIANLVRNFNPPGPEKDIILLIDPEYGLYTRNKIEKIAQQTGADMLLSFDFFAAVDGIYSPDYKLGSTDSLPLENLYNITLKQSSEVVYILSGWNIYDLKKLELSYSYRKIDTIKWVEPAYTLREAKRILPPRKDAVFNAADLAGTAFAEYFSPHWINVKRMYYQSGHYELKQTDELIKQNQWFEAAEIWKRNTSNSNKSIAAKSMFNMAVACEMQGKFDAAMDWAIKSLYVFGNKNDVNYYNCTNYIKILAQRKQDIQKIEGNLNPVNDSIPANSTQASPPILQEHSQ